ncbi:MAG: iron ABC transporter substrate-binding protein [Desulfitobacteriaceae bacterium]|nr:iron ABC transporter substrate-binding protein [Desulfitobacteriaceae bacterium]MDD4347342.1 iron ABC transporter substrate-binding protein [Desulfitobacteriaceae bacterium]MDD4401553.1 iron ABC transporter substrate-binding protein [Desulfitobacteriaceae bacterium]
MKNRIIILTVALLFCMTFLLSGCSSRTSQTASPKLTVTDTLGRQVEINGTAQKVVAIGPGALRLCCYFNNPAIFVGIEQMEIDSPTGRPYLYANPLLVELPVIGPGGPNNAPDPEKILAVKPDVIFTTYAADKATADNLQSKAGIPVVALSYGKMSTFDPRVNASLSLIGEIIGMDKRAQELVELMDRFKTDLDSRTNDIAEDKKPTAYVGGLGMKGTHGIESTQGNYSLFNAVHARNVVDEIGKTGSLIIDKEQLIKWNPDKIFIDGAGYPSVIEDYKKNTQFYKTLSAVKDGELYSILPYNFYTTNIDTAIADAYYIGKVLYPEKFTDLDPEKKADEIYKLLLGKEIYAQMEKDFGGFERVVLQ